MSTDLDRPGQPAGIERVPVTSSNLASVGYDPEARVLEVEFRGGAVWRYLDVPPEEHAALMAAESKGARFHTIKRRFAGVQVPPPES